jgi:hypothetical protein
MALGAAGGRARFNVLVRRVAVSPKLSSETLFTALYGDDASAFWLDSSAAQEPSAATAAAAGQGILEGEGASRAAVKGRFSFMGGLQSGGPLAHVVEYYYQQAPETGDGEESRVIRVETVNGQGERETEVLEGQSILPWLKHKVRQYT